MGEPGSRGLSYIAIVATVLLAAVTLRVLDPSPIAKLRLLTFDTYQLMSPRTYDPQAPVRIVDIDEASLQRVGQWPWPRSIVADLVTKLTQAGAAAIAFDMVFPEPDRLSPRELLRSLPKNLLPDVLRQSLGTLPSNDEMFAEVNAVSPVVLGVVMSNRSVTDPPQPRSGFAHAGADPAPFLTTFAGVVSNLESVQRDAPGLGALNWIPEADQVIRKVPILLRGGDNIYPSLTAESLRVAQGASSITVKSSGASGEFSFGEDTGVIAVKIGDLIVPTDAAGHVWIHFTPTNAARYIPAWRVLEGLATPEDVDGRIVFIGTSAAGLFDLQTTPIDAGVPGVEAHAQAVESIIAGDLLSRPDYAAGLEITYLVVAGLLLILLMRYLAVRWCLVAFIGCLVLVNAVSWFAFEEAKFLLDPVYPSLALAAVFVSGELFLFFKSEGERRYIRSAFSRYLSPDLVERLGEQQEELELGGEVRELTMMFCDVRSFTRISEGLSAAELTSLINRFLTPMTEAILEEHGTIDKYMGDAIMAFWNAPLDVPDHPRAACRAALEMIVRLERLNAELDEEARAQGREQMPLRIGVGINSGEVCVGNLGSSHRLDYSVIGDNVNLASRLEGQTKEYGVTIIVGESTMKQAPEIAAIELDLIRVKGKVNAERIYTILPGNRENPEFRALIERQQEMLATYRAMKWDETVQLIDTCREIAPAVLAPYYDMMATRIVELALDPPPDDWDGTHDALTK